MQPATRGRFVAGCSVPACADSPAQADSKSGSTFCWAGARGRNQGVSRFRSVVVGHTVLLATTG
eukprot:6935151-Alexandrium_andersonii.AAC.1